MHAAAARFAANFMFAALFAGARDALQLLSELVSDNDSDSGNSSLLNIPQSLIERADLR